MKNFINQEDGFSLLAVVLLVVLIGGFTATGTMIYKSWRIQADKVETNKKLEYIQAALQTYFEKNDRYPCPASLTAAPDTANFGVESHNGLCRDFPHPNQQPDGVFLTYAVAHTDRYNAAVVTGAVPVRALNIADEYMTDAFHHRFVYAVTLTQTVAGPAGNKSNTLITVEDAQGNNATSAPQNIAQLVLSTGGDTNGAYTSDGILARPCDKSQLTGENCDYFEIADYGDPIGTGATFVNTVTRSNNWQNPNFFVHAISYAAPQTDETCLNDIDNNVGKIAFLVDTSASMECATDYCPEGYTAPCRRIDSAHWAMRRVMPARIWRNYEGHTQDNPAMETFLSKFISTGPAIPPNYGDPSTTSQVTTHYNSSGGNPIFDNPSTHSPPYTRPADHIVVNNLESALQEMCPTAQTPLGVHIDALARFIGSGTEARPNKIVVISDGVNSIGRSPLEVVNDPTFPEHVEVDVIDVIGNPSLSQISEITGGNYYLASNPEELLQSLYQSTNACEAFTPTVVDSPLCSSTPPAVPFCGHLP